MRTPWGNTGELRERKLRPGPGASRNDVVRSQRERLFGATVISVSTRGYPDTTVAHLLELAGISRATFYEHFEDKADCFRATIEALLSAGLNLIRRDLKAVGPNPNEERGKQALETLLRLVADQPAAARVCLVDSYSAGSAGIEPIDKSFEEACEMLHEVLHEIPGREQALPSLSRAVIGGLLRVLYWALYRGEEHMLPAKSEELWRWATGYPPPPQALRVPRRRRIRQELPPVHGRDVHERIIRAFAAVAGARGVPGVTIGQIAAEASISLETFYRHFSDKQDLLLAAIDLSGAQLAAAAMPAARREEDWPRAIRRAIESVCTFLASEPGFARLRAVEIYAAGPEAIAHRDRTLEEILTAIVPLAARGESEQGRLALEATRGAVYALIYDKVRSDAFDELPTIAPLLAYVMLAPFLGAEEAAAVANGSEPPVGCR